MTFNEFKKQYYDIWDNSNEPNPNEWISHRIDFDISATSKILSESALYAVWWFITNNFKGKIIKNNTSKTEYYIHKNDVTDTFTLTATNQSPTKCDIRKYMELFDKSFNMKCELEQLKGQLKK